MAITAHFINSSEPILHSVLLECVEFSERHTAKNLAERLTDVAKAWKIEHKISACVSDNANNIVAAIRECKWRHLSCFAHSINLVVQRAIQVESVSGIISKIKSTVEHFRRSPHALSNLNASQQQMGLPKLILKQDVKTRWNSMLDMLS
ncbi:hypothetical protein NQ314_016430 [Rhamnusium bicolor]|uniref:Uncharacterized protein n=1 Tax=Rhamnusium bicolor TaxID=1586634 RepID=A0AAV8WWB3_9CUCU|nr:hypothetical protein NQ314_016430 [Rhamnusium bicolor]